jgi:hypothetical protein
MGPLPDTLYLKKIFGGKPVPTQNKAQVFGRADIRTMTSPNGAFLNLFNQHGQFVV